MMSLDSRCFQRDREELAHMARRNPGGATPTDRRVRGVQRKIVSARPHGRGHTRSALQAIDLYAGVGGWTLGLKMAGIETVASYEWWEAATKTHRLNFGYPIDPTDVRKLRASTLPPAALIVGSPPCTQFSFANRGGGGDIAEGLLDVEKFLSIVAARQPRFWVMENVPRVASILERELGVGGSLRRFAKLVRVITVVDMSEYGLPQGRKRMLAGNFDLQLLESYRGVLPRRTLGSVISALSSSPVVDPIYGITLKRNDLTGDEREPLLTEEETRMNREAKRFHPVYNRMTFPDDLSRPSRTVTATCTRVSRESIVIPAEGTEGNRRLTLRERASMQGFPITFQFYGNSYNDNLKMVGNAIPPLMVYYVAHTVLGTKPEELPATGDAYVHPLPEHLPSSYDLTVKNRYPPQRRFRAAIPNLRFGSGVRFELANEFVGEDPYWQVGFYFGTSKNILQAELGTPFLRRVRSGVGGTAYDRALRRAVGPLDALLDGVSGEDVQRTWAHQGESGVHPHRIVDDLGRAAETLHLLLKREPGEVEGLVLRHLARGAGSTDSSTGAKLRDNADWLLVGLLLGSWLNTTTIAKVPRQLSLVG